jgi:hypothetical protein
MLIVLLIAFGAVTALAPLGLALHTLWSAVPNSNADFEWLDV